MQGPATQSFRLRWRPELRFYEQRVPILRGLEGESLLEGFKMGEDAIAAQLSGLRWLSIWASGLTLNVLTEREDVSDLWPVVEEVCAALAPLQLSHARVSYQHMLELPFTLDEAIARGQGRLFHGLSTSEIVLGDWALLSDIYAAGPPASQGMIEFGIVNREEAPRRLQRMVGRGPGMLHIGEREWEPEAFKDVSLYADSDLTCPATEGQGGSFLEEAEQFWTTSRGQMTRLVEGLRTKLVGEP